MRTYHEPTEQTHLLTESQVRPDQIICAHAAQESKASVTLDAAAAVRVTLELGRALHKLCNEFIIGLQVAELAANLENYGNVRRSLDRTARF